MHDFEALTFQQSQRIKIWSPSIEWLHILKACKLKPLSKVSGPHRSQVWAKNPTFKFAFELFDILSKHEISALAYFFEISIKGLVCKDEYRITEMAKV